MSTCGVCGRQVETAGWSRASAGCVCAVRPGLLPNTFEAACSRGHRLIPSTGQCYSMVELGDEAGGFRYVTGTCDEVAAKVEAAAHPTAELAAC